MAIKVSTLYHALLVGALLAFAAPLSAEASEKKYRAAIATMARWKKDHPKRVRSQVIGRSREGRDLTVLRISASSKKDLPGLYLGASIHGREHSHEDLIRLIDDLLARDDPAIKTLLKTRVLWVQPMMNPDGVFHSKRKNAAGVDLNRNFDYRWGQWSSAKPRPSEGRYPGPKAFSEPESRAVRDFLIREKSIVLYFDFHRSARLILAPFGGSKEPIDTKLQELARGLDKAMGGRWNNRGNYQIHKVVPGGSGYTIDWVYGKLGVRALTLEYPYGPRPRDGESLRQALRFLMKEVVGLKRLGPRRWF